MTALNIILEEAIEYVETAEVDQTGSIDELAHSLVLIKELKKLLSIAQAAVEAEILANAKPCKMHSTRYSVSIRDVAQVRTDWPGLRQAMLAAMNEQRTVHPETGEIEPLETAIARLLPTVVPMTASVRPQQSGLRGINVQPNRYLELGEVTRQIRVTNVGQDFDLDREREDSRVSA